MNGQPDTATAIAALDQAMKALVLAKSALLGEGSAALFISAQDLAAEASPGNPYGSTKHGEFTAGSAAEAGRCPGEMGFQCYREAGHDGAHHSVPRPGPMCAAVRDSEDPWMCTLDAGHDGDHEAQTAGDPVHWPQDAGSAAEVAEGIPGWDLPLPGDGPDFCPAPWGEPPETALCSLASGHDGNHATAEGIEWGGRWETAEPKVMDAGLNCGDCGCGLGLHNLAGTHCNAHGTPCDPTVLPVRRTVTVEPGAKDGAR